MRIRYIHYCEFSLSLTITQFARAMSELSDLIITRLSNIGQTTFDSGDGKGMIGYSMFRRAKNYT